MAWDSSLSALAEIVTACARLEEPVAIEGLGNPRIENLVVAMPLELQTRVGDEGTLALTAAPPRQAAATTIMPVLHHIRLTVEVER